MRRIIIIISIVLGVLALLIGVYFAWQKSKTILTPPAVSQPVNQGGTVINQGAIINQTAGTTGQSVAPKLKIISDQPVFDYWVYTSSSGQTETFYLDQKGQILKVKEKDEKQDTIITSGAFDNPQAIKATLDGKQVLIKSGSLDLPNFTIFNVETKIQQLLPQGITAASWSADGKKIAYLESPQESKLPTGQAKAGKSDLVILDLSGQKQKTTKIISLSQNDFDLQWTQAEKFILTPKSSTFYQGTAWSFNSKNKTFTPLAPDSYGLIIKWSADGKLGLKFSTKSQGEKGSLSLINDGAQIRANLNFLTLPDKCFISEPKIYCAVPQAIPLNAVLPDDYFKKAVYFNDSIYQIDINQNSLIEIFTASEPSLDVSHLTWSNNRLLFINRYDNNLYSLEL